MSSLFADTHNVVAILEKSDAAEGFEQIIDFLSGSYIHYALTMSPHIYISCIKQFWNTASVKCSGDITSLVRNVNSSSKFYMYPRFIQLIIQNQVGDLSTHTIRFISPALTQKVFANMRRVGKGFSRVEIPLFEGMLAVRQPAEEEVAEAQVQVDAAVDAAIEAHVAEDVSHDAIPSPPPHVIPSPSLEPSLPPQQQHSSPHATPHDVEFLTQLQQVLNVCSTLSKRVENLETDNAAQKLEIVTLKARVKKLEKANKIKSSKLRRLRKVGTSKRVESSDDMEDVFNQRRMIADMDMNEGIELVKDAKVAESEGRNATEQAEKQAEIYNLDLDHSSKVLSLQEDDSEVQEVVEVVTIAKLITEVVTAAASQVSAASITIPAASATIPAAKPSVPAAAPTVVTAYTRRRKGVIIRDLKEELPLKTPAKTPKVKDKGKGILVEAPKPMKKKDQIEMDAEYARKLFNENIRFLFKSREEMEAEDQEIIKSLNETPAQKAAKRRKLSEEAQEAKDLRKRLEVVEDEDDDVFVEATCKSKVRQSRAKAVVAKVNSNSSTPAISFDAAELKDMVRALLLDKKNQSSAQATSHTPAPIKAVESNCVTCGVLRNIQSQGQSTQTQCQNIQNQYQIVQNQLANLTDMMSKFMSSNMASSSGSGTLPGPTIPTPSKVVKQGIEATKDPVQTPSPQSTAHVQPPITQSETPVSEPIDALVSAPMPNLKPSIPYPSRRENERRHEHANEQIEKFYEIFIDMSFEISFTGALILMPKFASTLKALIGNKEKFSEMARTPMNEHCSVVILNKLPKRLGDPGKFLISCEFSGMDECLALADLGASINLMPLSVWKELSLPELTPTCMTLELADRSVSKPIGNAKDVKVKVGMFHFPADFVVVDFEPDPRVPLILGRCFLRTGRALIDVHKGELTLQIRNEAITYNLDQTSRYSANYDQMTANKIDVTDEACEEYFQEVLGFSNFTASGSPTPSDDPIVSTTSPTLTLFGESDFLLFEEANAFLGLEDDPDSPELDPSYYDQEGDIQMFEAILNSDPAPSLPNLEQSSDRNNKPAVQHQRRVNPKIHDVIKKEVEKLLDAGLIYSISDSPWVSPVHCVPKKGGFTVVQNEENELIPTRLVTEWRVCIDYRKLNEATRKDHFPLPFMDQMLERLAGNEYYYFLDGFFRYFQIPIDPRDQEKNTFTCPYGTFAYRCIPFGLCNAPGMFQRCMLAIFHDMVEKTMEVFMDDFSVFGNSFKTCLSRLDKMLQSYAGFYRRFIKDFSKISRSMTHLLEKDTPFIFFEDCIKAFQTLKQKLTEAPILIAPNWDLPFELMCDASDFAIGAVLGQRYGKYFQPIHYVSKTLTEAESDYTTTEKEMLAVVYAFEKFRSYLTMNKCIVHTDHSALKYLFAKKDAKARLLRWVLLL
nr:DNA-directed DNA polymerase [Tanacetum cinerariifolium]